jgi:hypothetical protein
MKDRKQIQYYVNLDNICEEIQKVHHKYYSTWHWGGNSYETVLEDLLSLEPKIMEYNSFVRYLKKFATPKMIGGGNRALNYLQEFAKQNKTVTYEGS